MKATPLAAFAVAVSAALCALAPAPASAQGRDNVYAVAGVHVDATAANGAEAQAAGFATAQRQALDRLTRRLAVSPRPLPETVDQTMVERLVMSVDVEEQRRSATRFIGRLTVRFNPELARAFLQSQGYTLVENRSAPILLAPLAASDVAEETAALWRQVWVNGGFQNELVPLHVASADLQGAPNWQTAAPYAQASAAASVIYATLRVQGGNAIADVVEVDASGARSRGALTARIAGDDEASLRAALISLTQAVAQPVQDDWKARANTASTQRGRIAASAIYGDQRQWETIKDALEGAASTLISEIRIEAVGREGALVSFSFTGNESQLAAELARRGVRLEQTSMGPTLRVARQ